MYEGTGAWIAPWVGDGRLRQFDERRRGERHQNNLTNVKRIKSKGASKNGDCAERWGRTGRLCTFCYLAQAQKFGKSLEAKSQEKNLFPINEG
jgi:hypothetical protein